MRSLEEPMACPTDEGLGPDGLENTALSLSEK